MKKINIKTGFILILYILIMRIIQNALNLLLKKTKDGFQKLKREKMITNRWQRTFLKKEGN
jgi:hypothetical protein